MQDDSERYPMSQYVWRMPDLSYNTIGTAKIRAEIGVYNFGLLQKKDSSSSVVILHLNWQY